MAIKRVVQIDGAGERWMGYDTDTGDIVFLDGDTVTGRIDSTGFDASTFAIDSEAQGDLLRRGASGWERVAAGTSGQILVGDGTDIASVALSGDAVLSAAGALTLDNSLIDYATVELTAAEVKALASTPVEVVADSVVGADQALIVHSIMLVLDDGATPYDDAAADGDIVVEYSGGADIATFEADAFIDAGADAIRTVLAAAASPVAGEGIQITNDGAEFTTGDGTLNVHVWYSVVDIGLA